MRCIVRSLTTALAVLAVLCSAVAAEAQSPPAAGLSFSGVGINVADLARSEKFYTEVFGLTRVMRFPPEGKLLEVILSGPGQAGGMILALARFNDDPLPDGKTAYGRIIVTTPDAKAVLERMAAAGHAVPSVETPAPGRRGGA